MAVDNGSMLDGAVIEPQGALTNGADQWRLLLQNTKHRFINLRSGKCLTLATDSSADVTGLVQQTCSSGLTTQEFDFSQARDAWNIQAGG